MQGMIWIGLGVVLLIAVVVGLAWPRSTQQDLGTVSSTWIAENRSDPR